eukprot:TRINITY_DN3427_c0_g1_i2.p1 TRINITY_DN3427_c0_g1~~TRINITY_DN3427_c0_g1_i2.p1  ORF type:complete len:130 (+),score=26.17 TRINITY_DN3427_c0_g1_i2:268-657(+)
MLTNNLDLEWFYDNNTPEPIYDNQGSRINTLDERRRDKMMEERRLLIDMAYTMNPHFKPPADYSASSNKRFRKLWIPIDEHPNYNFVGLIVGPRGNSLKRLELETGCKILIRGGEANKPRRSWKSKTPQ